MIGWYVHHHGSGHLRRMQAVTAHLPHPVTVLSSLPAPKDWTGDWVQLPSDLGEDPDPTVRGALHWAPAQVPGYRDRMRRISNWVAAADPAAFVVDVSVEVVALVRLLGVRTATVVMPGDRTDDPHVLGYRLADLLLGPWPPGAHVLTRPPARRVVAVGGFSRYDGLPRPPIAPVPGRVLVLNGSGGAEIDDAALDAARAAAGGEWIARGGRWPQSTDLWRELAEADVVVTFAGQNAVADVAAARRPAVVVAAERPHDEQLATVRALRRMEVAMAVDRWPRPQEWPALLDSARTFGGQEWARWNPGHGARAMAAAILELAG